MARKKVSNGRKNQRAGSGANIEKIIENLPEEQKNALRLTFSKSSHYSGPIPPPDMLEIYERILPGPADRIISLTERQQKHRHFVEKSAVFHNVIYLHLGQIIGAILVLLIIYCSYQLTMNEHEVVGGSLGTLALGIAIVFVLKKKPSK